MVGAGHPQKQAVAAALDNARRHPKQGGGGTDATGAYDAYRPQTDDDRLYQEQHIGNAVETWPTSEQIAKTAAGLSSVPAIRAITAIHPSNIPSFATAETAKKKQSGGGLNLSIPKAAVSHALRLASQARQHAAEGLALQGKPGEQAFKTAFKGPIASGVPGRTDRHKLDVKPGSYVWPADVVSALGEGNTKAGYNQLIAMFSPIDLTGGMKGPSGESMRNISGQQRARINLQPAHLAKGEAQGGDTGGDEGNVPIIAAGGEVVTPPENIQWKFGNLDYGHEVCDNIVKLVRQKEIARLKTAPPPKK